ncbi:MAG TPA: hypothetical protein VG815_09685 [Chloroflexota bacterium]|nr:hypothetical protein [Chloroflexota bacterium]
MAYIHLRDAGSMAYMWDVHYDTSTKVDMSWDGLALGVEIEAFPADLSNTPCASEVAAVLRERGFAVDEKTVPSGPPIADLAREPPDVAPMEPILKPGTIAANPCWRARFRDGQAPVFDDVVGDGSIVVEYSYYGAALGLHVMRPDLPLVLDGVPFSNYLNEEFGKLGMEVADLDDIRNTRPFLLNLQRDRSLRLANVEIAFSIAFD